MLKRFQHLDLMKKKISIMIFIVSILIIIGYISLSELLSMKKNVHSTIIPENKVGSFIARGPIVSLLYNDGAAKSTFDGNHYEGNKPPATSPLVSGKLFATDSDSNLTHSIMGAPAGAIYDNRTLDSNNIDLLTKIIISSTYNTNRTAEYESSTEQFVPTPKMEPQILSGNWMFKVDQGIIKDFQAKFTMVRINGTERNIYELYNFRPDVKNFTHISTSSRVHIIDAIIDIKLNGENLWKDVNCTIVISKDNIIKIMLNSRLIENQFNNQPIYGIIESFEAKEGNHKTIEGLVDERSTKAAVTESRSHVGTNTTQVIFEIIDSLKKQSSHDIIAKNAMRKAQLDQFYTDANNLPYDMSRDSSIAEGHTNVIIVKGADKLSNGRFFYPQNLFVTPGSTITWLNQDSAIHTATSTNGEELITDYIFDTDFIQTGQSSKPIRMPQQDGLISYYCKLHPFMTGTVTVTSTSDETIDTR
jgi:plastocyanin